MQLEMPGLHWGRGEMEVGGRALDGGNAWGFFHPWTSEKAPKVDIVVLNPFIFYLKQIDFTLGNYSSPSRYMG